MIVMFTPVPKLDRICVQCLLVHCCGGWGALSSGNVKIGPAVGFFVCIFEACKVCAMLIYFARMLNVSWACTIWLGPNQFPHIKDNAKTKRKALFLCGR